MYKEISNRLTAGSSIASDDKIVTGYTCDGLPFQIIVESRLPVNTEYLSQFIGEIVTPLMDQFSETISTSEDYQKSVKDLINTINSLRLQHVPSLDFTMSIGITYQRDNDLYCAGFGSDDIGLKLRKPNGEIQQLTSTHPNSIFNVKVGPGDKIFGYTYLPPNLLSLEIESAVTIPTKVLQEQLKQEVYIQETAKLKTLINNQKDEGIKLKANNVYNKVMELGKQERPNFSKIARYTAKANRALKSPNQENVKDLILSGEEANASYESGTQCLGVFLILLGAGLTIAGGLMVATGILAATSGNVLPSIFLIAYGMLFAAAGLSTFSMGVSMFFSRREVVKNKANFADETPALITPEGSSSPLALSQNL